TAGNKRFFVHHLGMKRDKQLPYSVFSPPPFFPLMLFPPCPCSCSFKVDFIQLLKMWESETRKRTSGKGNTVSDLFPVSTLHSVLELNPPSSLF
uniref:Uncharacterized protein n=1 Tax=Anabas testudineus TaxID=64144 RepID=A0A3Q1JEU7_ANATE